MRRRALGSLGELGELVPKQLEILERVSPRKLGGHSPGSHRSHLTPFSGDVPARHTRPPIWTAPALPSSCAPASRERVGALHPTMREAVIVTRGGLPREADDRSWPHSAIFAASRVTTPSGAC